MLKRLRNFADKTGGKIFLFAIAACFALLWGGNFSSMLVKGRANSKVLVTVQGEPITEHDLFNFCIYKRVNPLTIKSSPQVLRAYLDEMIRFRLRALEAGKLGLAVGDDAIRVRLAQQFPKIKKKGNISINTGEIDEKGLKKYLSNNGLNNQDYINLVTDDLKGEQLIYMFPMTLPSSWFVRDILNYKTRVLNISYKPFLFSEVKIEDKPEELKEVYEKNKNIFEMVETRSFSLLLCKSKDLDELALLKANKRELIENEYKQGMNGEYKGRTMESSWSDIKKKIAETLRLDIERELINQTLDLVANDESFENISKSAAFELIDYPAVYANGSKVDGSKTEESASWLKEVVDKVFAMTEGEVSDVIQTKEGDIILVKVNDIKAKYYKPLNEVKDKVLKLWEKDYRLQKMRKVAMDEFDNLYKLKGEDAVKKREKIFKGFKGVKQANLKANKMDEFVIDLDSQSKFELSRALNGDVVFAKDDKGFYLLMLKGIKNGNRKEIDSKKERKSLSSILFNERLFFLHRFLVYKYQIIYPVS